MSAVAELVRVIDGLPDDWRKVRLGDVSRSFAGGTPSRSNPAFYGPGIPWLKSGEVRAGRISGVEEEITEAGLRGSSARVAKAGSPVIAMYGATAGVAGILEIDAALNQAVLAIEPLETKLDREFCFHLLSSEAPRLLTMTQGSGQPNLSKSLIDGLNISLPPIEEQQRIAEVLRSVDEAIAANEAVAAQARRAYQAALAELVGNGHDHWETVCLGQIATFVNGRGFKPHEWVEEGFPIIRIQNLNGGTDFNYYNGDFNPKILVRPGDLLFAWSGSRGTSFGPHIWRGPKGVLNYHTWRVVPAAPEDRDYLYFALRHLTKKIEDEAHGASALVHMQKAYVVDYEIHLPPPEERIAIAATLIDLQEAANHADQVYREAQAMKGHLMHDILSGHVRVPA